MAKRTVINPAATFLDKEKKKEMHNIPFNSFTDRIFEDYMLLSDDVKKELRFSKYFEVRASKEYKG